jgi:uncharacterized protein YciI
MSYFAVTREAGPGWIVGTGAREQPGADDHAVFMNGLAEQGFVLLAGPLAGSHNGRLRALVIVEAESEAEIRTRLAEDPWAVTECLTTTSIEPWSLIVGWSGSFPARAPSRPTA